jgi:hypothetical protein
MCLIFCSQSKHFLVLFHMNCPDVYSLSVINLYVYILLKTFHSIEKKTNFKNQKPLPIYSTKSTKFMFLFEQKSEKDSGNKKSKTRGDNNQEINPAQMLHEQHKAMVRNSTPLQMMVEEEEEPLQGKMIQRQSSPEEEEPLQGKMIQKKSSPEEEAEIQTKKSSRTTQKVSESSGVETQIPENVQAKMESSFGTSFQGVNIHQNDGGATQMGALAYTQGENIHFAPGQYNPDSPKGQELLGHELTHVVQQRQGRVAETKQTKGVSVNDNPALEKEADDMGVKAANSTSSGSSIQFKNSGTSPNTVIQHKIIVDGNPYTPQESYKQYLIDNYSEEMVELIMSMHNEGNPPDYNFDSYEQMGREVQMRYNAIEGMGEANNDSTHYGSTGNLNTSYWDKVGAYHFQVKAGVEPSVAIESIFDPSENNVLECNSMMVAIQYRAMLKTLGATKFNEKFPNGSGILISPHHQPLVVSTHPIWEQNLFKYVTISSSADLLPGDWIYFKNMDDYIDKHPGGLWSGEHTMYLGDGKFRGFGTSEKTEQQMLDKLMEAYNTGLPDIEKITNTSQLPGLMNYARRPVISEIEK